MKVFKEKPSDSWATPDWLFEKLNKEFNFQIDLCATRYNSKCVRFCHDFLNDELASCKHGLQVIDSEEYVSLWLYVIMSADRPSAFMNPPYSNPFTFIERAWNESKYMRIVCLLKVDTSTKWWGIFLDYVKHAPKKGCQIRFLPKRIKFIPPQGMTASTSNFPSCVVIIDRRASC